MSDRDSSEKKSDHIMPDDGKDSKLPEVFDSAFSEMDNDTKITVAEDRSTEEDAVVSSAWWVSFGTLLSRIVGLARQVLMANIFGTGMAMDAFRVAFRIPNLLRQVIGEGGLTRVFMPIYAEIAEKRGKKAADSFTATLSIILLFVLIGLAVLLYIAAPIFIPWLADGWQDEPEKIELAIKLLRLLTPFVVFIGFYALYMGYLNSNRKFFLPASGPAFFNSIWFLGLIVVMIFFNGADEIKKMIVVVAAMIVASIVQFLIEVPASKKLGAFESPSLTEYRGKIIELGKLLTPALFATAVNQINMIVDIKLASRLMEGSISALSYASMLIYFPIGLVSKAISTASLPSLSDYTAKDDVKEMTSMLSYTLRLVLALMIPIAFLSFTMRLEIIELLFERGNFTAEVSTPLTSYALMGYIFTIIGMGCAHIMIQAFYALKDITTLIIVPVIMAGCNILFNILLVDPLIHGGLALATSIASFIYLVSLIIIFQLRVGGLRAGKIVRLGGAFTAISLAASFLAWAITKLVRQYIIIGAPLADKLINLLIPMTIASLFVIALYHLFGFDEYKKLSKPLYRRLRRVLGRRQ